MATKASTIQYLLEQIRDVGNVRVLKMFGEYALYCDDKVVALVCDDQLFIKPTQIGKSLIVSVVEKPPYPGAKNYLLIETDLWENPEWLGNLIVETARALPMPKKKNVKKI